MNSAVVSFPNDSADPGPAAGRLPTDPFLVNGPFINQALLNQRFPPGTLLRNAGVVRFDSPDRKQPYAHQFTVGYGRQVGATIAVQADYIHMQNKDMFLGRNLNPMVRANTTRTGAITRQDAFGVLGEAYSQQVWVMENTGESKYDALNLSLEKRYANNWSGRLSYSFSSSRGTAENQADTNTYQVLTNLNLDGRYGPTSVDRRHILSLNGRAEVPKTKGLAVSSTLRWMSGAPFTIFDSNVDVDQNGELTDPLPAGTYSGTVVNALTNVESKGGRNGAIGPDYFQIDVRAGWRARLGRDRSLDIYLDIFNITDRVNWDNPSGDRRLTPTFLQLTTLRGGSGFPRQRDQDDTGCHVVGRGTRLGQKEDHSRSLPGSRGRRLETRTRAVVVVDDQVTLSGLRTRCTSSSTIRATSGSKVRVVRMKASRCITGGASRCRVGGQRRSARQHGGRCLVCRQCPDTLCMRYTIRGQHPDFSPACDITCQEFHMVLALPNARPCPVDAGRRRPGHEDGVAVRAAAVGQDHARPPSSAAAAPSRRVALSQLGR